MSPDGTQMVYVAMPGPQLYLRSMSDLEVKPISGTGVYDGVSEPAFSPDGRSIAFFARADRTLKRIAVTGGAAVTICAVEGSPSGLSWGSDAIVFGQGNVIPENASAKGDVRAVSREEFDRVERDLTRVSQNRLILDTQVKTTLVRGLPPMPRTPQTDAPIKTAEAIYAEIGKTLTIEGSGGAADASLAADEGVPTLDGLGIVGGGAHTPDEYAEVGSVVRACICCPAS